MQNSVETTFVIPPPPAVSLPVTGTDARFPVRRVHCVGRNYADHAREMGQDPDRAPPVFFAKAPDCLVVDGGAFPFPPASLEVHHEVELVVALQGGGRDLQPEQAPGLIFGYAVGIDFTRRDLQAQAKATGGPWEMAKAFDQSAPCGVLAPAAAIGHPSGGRITLSINGETRQDGDLAAMIWSVPEIVATLSRLVALAPGDVIYTGTPAGVGPVDRGDRLTGRIEGVGVVETVVV